jgi:hypothetical protein
LSFMSPAPNWLVFPMRIERGSFVLEINEIDAHRKYATGYLEGPVDRETLRVTDQRTLLSGETVPQGIDLPEMSDFADEIAGVANVIAFVADVPVLMARCSHLDALVSEDAQDQELFAKLGTRELDKTMRSLVSLRTFTPGDLRSDYLDVLLARRPGVALYAHALLTNDSRGRFCEFWRVLESAFGAADDKLVQCLAGFDGAKELEFTVPELKGLLTLRGRASHANSRRGLKEIRDVGRETATQLPRLKCLVERVILTKKSWGTKALGVDPLSRLAGYVRSENRVVYFRRNMNEK